jgi:1-acyl-sn-glycerol-3-phosphate acyltransferase
MKTYSVPLINRISRRVGRPIIRTIFHLLGDVKVFGRENVPRQGPYLITINHVSLFEPPFTLAFWPTPPEAAGASEIWVLETMISVLQSGRPLLLAPEGGRTHDLGMRRALPGIAYLVDKTGVPVIPVGVVGTTDDFINQAIHFKRPRLELHIGKAISLPPVDGKGAARREALQANTDQIMLAIAALVPSKYRGVYQDSNEAS